MTKDDLEAIRSTYEAAASTVGLPDGWFVRVETAKWVAREMEGMGAYGMDEELDGIAMPMVVNGSGIAHIIAEHDGPVKQVHAERHIEKGVEEHLS